MTKDSGGMGLLTQKCLRSLCYHSSTWMNICTEVGGGGGGMKASRGENGENYCFCFFVS